MKALYQYTQTVATDGGPVTVQHDYEHSAPMAAGHRRAVYLMQGGGGVFTVRQLRSMRKARKRSIGRASVLLGGAR